MKTLKLSISKRIRKSSSFVDAILRKSTAFMVAISALVMMAIPSFAADLDLSTGVLPADAFDPMVTAVTSNIGAVLPKVLILAGLIIGIGLAVMLFKKFAK